MTTQQELSIDYYKVGNLPSLVRSLCHGSNGWIVGSGAKYLLNLKQDPPNDWDIIIPHTHWKAASKSVPVCTLSNSHGGFKIEDDNTRIDLWTQDIGDFLGETPNPPEYAVSLKFMRYLKCYDKWLRVKK